MIGIFASPSGHHRGVLVGASQSDIAAGDEFWPMHPTDAHPRTWSSFRDLENRREITRDTPILMERYSLKLINRDTVEAIHYQENEPEPKSQLQAFESFERCLRNVLEITPPTLPPNKPYSCLETIYECLRMKYIRLLQYERAFDNLLKMCAPTLQDVDTDKLYELKYHRAQITGKTNLEGMDIASTWITTNRETLARELRAVASAIKDPLRLSFAISVHPYERRFRKFELPIELASLIMRMV